MQESVEEVVGSWATAPPTDLRKPQVYLVCGSDVNMSRALFRRNSPRRAGLTNENLTACSMPPGSSTTSSGGFQFSVTLARNAANSAHHRDITQPPRRQASRNPPRIHPRVQYRHRIRLPPAPPCRRNRRSSRGCVLPSTRSRSAEVSRV